jgi:hypothetical protein
LFKSAGAAVALRLVRQFEPVPGHVEQENPAVQVVDMLGELDAIGGIESVAGDGFPIHRTIPQDVFTPMRLLT